MDKRLLLVIVIIVLLFIGLGFVFGNHKWVGNVIAAFDDDPYSYTKAICNKSNYCQDYEVSCEGEEVVDLQPVTGAAIQQADDWVDPRQDKALCE